MVEPTTLAADFSSILFAQLAVDPIYGLWVVVALTLITLASLFLTLSAKQISRSKRWLLASLRVFSSAMLLLAWMRPAMLSTSHRASEGAIAVLMDRSQSMTLPSSAAGMTRWNAQQEVWQALAQGTDLTVGGAKLIPYFFDRTASLAPQQDLPALDRSFSQEPEGRGTDLGAALAEVVKMQTDPPLRGVVMMGDATQTQLPPESDPLLIAKQMAQLDQPIYFVGIGSRGESSLLRDVAVENLQDEITAFANKEISVPLVISANGMQNQPIDVTLTLRSAQQPDRELKRRRVLPAQSAEKIPLDFRIQLSEPGDYLLVAQARVDTNEQVSSNNQQLSFVTVREGGVRILMLEGQPRYEQRYLKLSLDASVDFDVQYAWLPERQRARWPIDLSGQIDFQGVDIFVIGDLDSAALHTNTQKGILDRVSQGAGLLFLGGYHSFDAGGYQSSQLAAAIPVQMLPDRQNWDQKIDQRFHVVQPVQLLPTRPHPVTSLLPEPDNTRLWEMLKPMDGMNRFQKVSTAPGTQVLLADALGQPGLVAGQFASGRVLAFAGDSTWRWYLAGAEFGQKKAHQTFWRQAMLWLVSRDKLEEGFRLTIDSRRQDIDATPRIGIEWYGGSDQAPMPPEVQLTLSRDRTLLRQVESTAVGENLRECNLTGLDRPGLYQVDLTANDSTGKKLTGQVAFIVQDISRELTTPETDWQMMSNLVAAGSSSGSELFLPEDIGKLIAKIQQRQSDAKTQIIQRRSLGDEAWDSWLFALLFCGLMSAEWALRKRWQLP